MRGALLFISAILIFNSCDIFNDRNLRDDIVNINFTEDTLAFHQFAIVELQENDKFYNFNQSVSLTFSGITQDSRCPLDVVCVSEGSVTVKIDIHEDGNEAITDYLSLPGSNNYLIYKHTYIRLIKVTPFPKHADTPLRNYTITLEIRPVDSECQSAIIDTDQFNNPWVDDFIYEEVQIVNGTINAKIQYGGGCGTIQYELVSDGQYLITDPPQLNLTLSFKDEDDCEALVTTTLCFDLSVFQINPESGTVHINLTGWDTPLIYAY